MVTLILLILYLFLNCAFIALYLGSNSKIKGVNDYLHDVLAYIKKTLKKGFIPGVTVILFYLFNAPAIITLLFIYFVKTIVCRDN